MHRCHVCLHGEKRAIRRGFGMVRDIHAAKGSALASDVMAVHDVAVGKDVRKGAFGTELAVALCEVLAGRALGQRLIGVEERTGFAGLAGALTVEFARHVRGTCRCQYLDICRRGRLDVLLLLGGLRGPAKGISRMFAPFPFPCPCPFAMRPCDPFGTGIGCPLPFAPAMLLCELSLKSVEGRCAIRGAPWVVWLAKLGLGWSW
jgi:hypothetical protein